MSISKQEIDTFNKIALKTSKLNHLKYEFWIYGKMYCGTILLDADTKGKNINTYKSFCQGGEHFLNKTLKGK